MVDRFCPENAQQTTRRQLNEAKEVVAVAAQVKNQS
jgi:hypothetical protein